MSRLKRLAAFLHSLPAARAANTYLLWISGLLRKIRSRTPIEPRTVALCSYAGRGYSCSPRAIYEEMRDDPRFQEWRFVWALESPEDAPPELTGHTRTRVVQYGSASFYAAFTSAQYWVVNSMLPLNLQKRSGQRMLQCWHGTPFKRLRADVRGSGSAINGPRDFLRMNRFDVPRFDAFTFQSDFGERTLSTAFQFSRFNPTMQRLRVGLPRNAELFHYPSDRICEIRNALGIPPGKRVVFYAPTWRDDAADSQGGFAFQHPLDYREIVEGLGSDTVLLFRAHYLITSLPDFSAFPGRIIDASGADNINDLYAISDLLITDYSSVFFDYGSLHRPIVFFMKDLENYRDNLRGFYLELTQLPGPVTTNESALVHEVVAALSDPSPIAASGELASWDSENSTRQVVDAFFATDQ